MPPIYTPTHPSTHQSFHLANSASNLRVFDHRFFRSMGMLNNMFRVTRDCGVVIVYRRGGLCCYCFDMLGLCVNRWTLAVFVLAVLQTVIVRRVCYWTSAML
eukprot:GHVQ01008956.1.p1 GENE.GHVQ01008956.1~~GHVQ01008956.1.p1  ORF type:complete len:119 (+),score=3.81 GHVQ01008956.1:54-359(+)